MISASLLIERSACSTLVTGHLIQAALELISTLSGDALVGATLVVVAALALQIGALFGGLGIRIAMPETFAGVVETLVDVSSNGLACSVACVKDTASNGERVLQKGNRMVSVHGLQRRWGLSWDGERRLTP